MKGKTSVAFADSLCLIAALVLCGFRSMPFFHSLDCFSLTAEEVLTSGVWSNGLAGFPGFPREWLAAGLMSSPILFLSLAPAEAITLFSFVLFLLELFYLRKIGAERRWNAGGFAVAVVALTGLLANSSFTPIDIFIVALTQSLILSVMVFTPLNAINVLLVFLIWVNCDYSFFAALVLLLFYAFASMVVGETRRALWFGLIVGISAFLTSMHPKGLRVWDDIGLAISGDSPLFSKFSGFLPTNFHETPLTALAIAALLFLVPLAKRRGHPDIVAPLVGSAILALFATAFLPVFFVFFAIAAGDVITSFLPKDDICGLTLRSWLLRVPVAVLFGLLLPVYTVDPGYGPLAKSLERHRRIVEPLGMEQKPFHEISVGCGLRNQGAMQTVDERVELWREGDPSPLELVETLHETKEGWKEAFIEAKFNVALLRDDRPLVEILKRELGWRELERVVRKSEQGTGSSTFVVLVPSLIHEESIKAGVESSAAG